MISKLVLYVNRLAHQQDRISVTDIVAEDIIAYLYGKRNNLNSYSKAVAREIIQGAPTKNRDVKRIRNRVLKELRDYHFFVSCINEFGYRPILLRSATAIHWPELQTTSLLSEERTILIDIESALVDCSEKTQTIIRALMCGYSGQEIAKAFKTHQTKLINSALRELSNQLEPGNG